MTQNVAETKNTKTKKNCHRCWHHALTAGNLQPSQRMKKGSHASVSMNETLSVWDESPLPCKSAGNSLHARPNFPFICFSRTRGRTQTDANDLRLLLFLHLFMWWRSLTGLVLPSSRMKSLKTNYRDSGEDVLI